jgi:glycosyltransferase involved in cell wall biosynthesis
VRHGETGYLVRHGDEQALAQRMLQVAGEPSLVERLGSAARRFAEDHTWERSAQATERHLQDLIAGSA